MNFLQFPNRKKDKIYFHYDYGRGKGQRPSTGIFIYTQPKDQIQKNHNKEALKLLAVKKSQLTIDQQAIGSNFIPEHKFKSNFLDYYEEFVKNNSRKGNRHLLNSLTQFKAFLEKDFISPIDITENLCKRFRQHLLDKYNGLTPLNYFSRFKEVVSAATSDKYFLKNPIEEVKAKSNPSTTLKEILEVDDYLALLNTPCFNEEVRAAFIFSLYTGLRWVDVKVLQLTDINGDLLTTRIIQKKTGQPVVLTLHPIAKAILDRQKDKVSTRRNEPNRVFIIPCHDGSNKVLEVWMKAAGIKKHITWSCARLSFSVLLQDKNVDDATVAYLMGHTTTDLVRSTYKRHRPKDQTAAISQLPAPGQLPHFLNSGN
jgi:integrase